MDPRSHSWIVESDFFNTDFWKIVGMEGEFNIKYVNKYGRCGL